LSKPSLENVAHALVRAASRLSRRLSSGICP
jgi:hypothetical protein